MPDTAKHPLRIRGGPAEASGFVALAVRIAERMNAPREIAVRVACADQKVSLDDLVGEEFEVIVEAEGGEVRRHAGLCVAAEYAGNGEDGAYFDIELRSGLWFLGRTGECRIFQDMTAVDVVMEVLGEYGLARDVVKRLDRTAPARTICVQYRESDLAFVDRLLEGEGICYFLEEDGKGGERMVLADSIGAHQAIAGDDLLLYHPVAGGNAPESAFVTDWRAGGRATSGRVTLKDYDFEKPGADLTAVKATPVGRHPNRDRELYDYPGHYAEQSDGDDLARIRMEAEAARARAFRASSNVARLTVGRTFRLDRHPRIGRGEAQLVTAVRRGYALDFPGHADPAAGAMAGAAPSLVAEAVQIEGLAADVQFRPAQVTPAPRIAGVQTAVVTGPGGEEVHTDEYGRVRIQFHWDRLGKADDKSTCWVRVATPWSGKNWGAIAVPRIGQEVVVQFEEGDPDRPLVTGMLYNAATMPPYPLPASRTQQGVKTNSSKGGGGYNELVMEDKKGAEYVRFQSERDFHQIVKNDAMINIGFEHASRGDLTQMIKRNATEITGEVRTHITGMIEDLTVGMVYDEGVGLAKTQLIGVYKEEKVGIGKQDFTTPAGFASLAVAVGSPASTLYDGGKYADFGAAATATNALLGALKQPGKREEIHGLSHLEVHGDRVQEISRSSYRGPPREGHLKTTVKDGDVETVVEKGKHFLKVETGPQIVSVLKGDRQIGVEKGDLVTGVDAGDMRTHVRKGKVLVEAAQEIKFKVGPSTLTMTPSKIELKIGPSTVTLDMNAVESKGPQAKLIGDLVAKVDAAKTSISGDLTMVDGSMVMIN